MAVRLCPPDEVVEVWNALTPFIKSFLKHSQGESDLVSILEHILSLEFQCWLVEDDAGLQAVCITKIEHWVGYSSLFILGLSGNDWETWKDAHGTLEDFARFHKLSRITILGRPGWKRIFKKHNFTGRNGEEYKHVYDALHMVIE